MELIMSGISLTWLILNLNRLKLSKKAGYLIGGFVLLSTASFLITKSHWSDFLQSLNFVLVMNCVGAAFVEKEKRRGGFLFASLIFSLVLLLNFIHFIINKSIAGMAGNQNWFAALISACLPFALYGVYKLLASKTSKNTAIIISSIIILPAYFYCIYNAQPRATYAALVLVMLILLAKYLNKKSFYPALALVIITAISWGFLNSTNVNHQVKKFQAGDIRLVLWNGCAAMIKDNFFFGVGQKRFGEKFSPYDTIEHKKHHHHPDEVTHPHNQFLLIATENGAPAALAFLCICLLILKQGGLSRDPMEVIFFMAFFILIVQGFVDKALHMPPTSLMAPLCAAFIWSHFMAYKRCDGCFKHKKYLRVIAALFSVLIIWQSLIELRTALLWRESKIIFKQAKKESYKVGEANLIKAHELEPRKILYQYGLMKAYMSPLNELGKALKVAEKIYNYAPQYIQINRNIGHILTQANQIEKAEKFYVDNLLLHPWSVNGYLDVINAKTRLGKKKEALIFFDKLEKTYLEKFTVALLKNDKNLSDERTQWLQHSGIKDWYNHSTQIISSISFRMSKDIFYNKEKKYPNLSYYYDTSFNNFDVTFWNDMKQLNQLISKEVKPHEIIAKINKEIKLIGQGEYLNPGESLRQKSAEPLSYACLLVSALRQKKILAGLLLKANQLQGLIIYYEGKNWFCAIGRSELIPFKEDTYKECSIYGFFYPQEVALRNHLLSTLLNSDEQFFQLATWPVIEAQKFQLATGFRYTDILPLPFKKMNDQLTKMLNQ